MLAENRVRVKVVSLREFPKQWRATCAAPGHGANISVANASSVRRRWIGCLGRSPEGDGDRGGEARHRDRGCQGDRRLIQNVLHGPGTDTLISPAPAGYVIRTGGQCKEVLFDRLNLGTQKMANDVA
jgi:hypothetical protein